MRIGSRCGAALAVALLASTCLGTVSAAAASSKSEIVLGYVGDLTGAASSTFADGPGAAQAAIDLQNSEGGVDGHKLKLIVGDTQSSPTAAATTAQNLVETDHVFGVIENSALFFGAAPYLEKAGIPVTGTALDGPEWNTDANMFSAGGPPVDAAIGGRLWATTITQNFFKALGVKKVAMLAANSPSAVQSASSDSYPWTSAGLSICYDNTSLPLGAVDTTTLVLGMKNAGCQGFETLYVDSTDVALSQAIKNAGLESQIKAQLYSEGYDNNVLDSPSARASAQGDYFATGINFTTPNAATKTMLDALERYDHTGFPGGIPDLGLFGGWESAELMIYGLQHDPELTDASFITNLHKVASYDANGLFASSWGFNHMGTAQEFPSKVCEYVVQLKGDKFVTALDGKPLCGKYVPTVPSS